LPEKDSGWPSVKSAVSPVKVTLATAHVSASDVVLAGVVVTEKVAPVPVVVEASSANFPVGS
jgi:hypothetical protein